MVEDTLLSVLWTRKFVDPKEKISKAPLQILHKLSVTKKVSKQKTRR